jgi:hypothetical protein
LSNFSWDVIPGKLLKNTPCRRKLALVADKEGKTRIVAIFDYWSQVLLQPIHERLSNILLKIPQDCTFNQNNFKACLTPANALRGYYSVDLKTATDRFPVVLQEMIMGQIFDDPYFAAAWRKIMVGTPFMSPDGVSRAYAQGQPMGAYSS